MIKHIAHCIHTSEVVDSRCQNSDLVWRRRRCKKCHRRFTTYEIDQERYEQLLQLENFVRKLAAFKDQAAKIADAISTTTIKPEVRTSIF